MTPTVHILVTCRKPELAEYSTLVFKTIRVGFPTAEIIIHHNQPSTLPDGDVAKAARGIAWSHFTCTETIHHEWIQELLTSSKEPFFICDTDIIFRESVEDWQFTEPLAGRLIPEWFDEFTNCVTRQRLHTSLIYLDPNGIRDRLEKYRSQFPETPFNPFANLIYPLCLPLNGKTYFHDTCSLLYHAIGGQAFTEQQLDAFDHLNFGTISDIVLPRLSDGDQMRKLREEIIADPAKAKGLWRIQEAYYASRQACPKPTEVRKVDQEKCHEFAQAVCCGNQAALQFCQLWMEYCHQIDDIIDLRKDGYLVMDSESILKTFILALQIYNSPFYVANRDHLMPIVYAVTNEYADSVLFENSNEPHKRAIADVNRCCGNTMFDIVALICGGWDHLRRLSPLIRERSWLIQHSE